MNLAEKGLQIQGNEWNEDLRETKSDGRQKSDGFTQLAKESIFLL